MPRAELRVLRSALSDVGLPDIGLSGQGSVDAACVANNSPSRSPLTT